VHPVKSLRGVAVRAAEIGELGLALDRRWLLVDEAGVFLTQREDARLALLHAALRAPGARAADADADVAMHDATLRVRAPGGAVLDVPRPPADAPRRAVRIWAHTVEAVGYPPAVDAWFSDALGRRCHLVWMPDDARRPVDHPSAGAHDRAPFSDGFPVLVVTQASLDDLNARLVARGAAPVTIERFRANVVVAGADAPYAEDDWSQVDVGEAALALVKPCGRCVMVTIDPESGRGGHEPLRTLAEYRKVGSKVLFAQNALVRRGGLVRVGDVVAPHARAAPLHA
jgi:hypothetical protein